MWRAATDYILVVMLITMRMDTGIFKELLRLRYMGNAELYPLYTALAEVYGLRYGEILTATAGWSVCTEMSNIS